MTFHYNHVKSFQSHISYHRPPLQISVFWYSYDKLFSEAIWNPKTLINMPSPILCKVVWNSHLLYYGECGLVVVYVIIKLLYTLPHYAPNYLLTWSVWRNCESSRLLMNLDVESQYFEFLSVGITPVNDGGSQK